MNVAKSYEQALATVIREYGDLPDDVLIRAWQTIDHDASWDESVDRAFPLIDIRATPARTDDNQATLACECAILVGTMTADDRDHFDVSDLYDRVQGVLDDLYAQFRAQVNGSEKTRFDAIMAGNLTSDEYSFGGFTFGDGLAPYDDKGVNMIGISMTLHFSRTDF